MFLAVAASWVGGVPFVGTVGPGAAAVAASQKKLDLVALLERPDRHQVGREKMMQRGERLYARWGWLAVFVTPAIVSGTAKMPPFRFAVFNLLDSLGWSVSVAASAYGVSRLATGHHTGHDVAILIIGLAAAVLGAITAVRRHRRRRTQRLGSTVNEPSDSP